jgi:hypothetical protein
MVLQQTLITSMKLKDPRTYDALLSILNDTKCNRIQWDNKTDGMDNYLSCCHLRTIAIKALQAIGNIDVIPYLIDILGEKDIYLRRDAQNALSSFGKEAINPLILIVIGDKNRIIRVGAARVLANKVNYDQFHELKSFIDKKDNYSLSISYPFLIYIGNTAVENSLISALEAYGDIEMATTFLNCGNGELKGAATQWAKKKGLLIRSGGYGNEPKWGKNK